MQTDDARARRRTFAEPSHQQAYDALRRMRPSVEEYRGMGGGGNAYAVGYTQPDSPARIFPRNSKSYAHWAAGVDNARDDAASPQPASEDAATLREALEPFAKAADRVNHNHKTAFVFVEDLYRARAALSTTADRGEASKIDHTPEKSGISAMGDAGSFTDRGEAGSAPGWQMVPIEPTEGMLVAGSEDVHHEIVLAVWSAMLAAAPQPTAASSSVGEDEAVALLQMLIGCDEEAAPNGLMDAIDNDGYPYQSTAMAGLIAHARGVVPGNSVAERAAAYRASLSHAPGGDGSGTAATIGGERA